jgi:hypothetical protein
LVWSANTIEPKMPYHPLPHFEALKPWPSKILP